jgi:hypothetical protein
VSRRQSGANLAGPVHGCDDGRHLALIPILTVVNGAFGYIALQNKIDPETLVLNYHKDRMLAMPSTRNSEDDAELVAGIAPRDQAIGFFG